MLGTRICEHIRSIGDGDTAGVPSHFNRPGHSEADFQCTVIERRPARELRPREAELIRRLRVREAGMNVLGGNVPRGSFNIENVGEVDDDSD